ncbi:phosphotransferase [Streptomyces kaniharaensis]|uniref:phosphotransferase n=1 Tax=Streptomyces kaniharaensis TaxID=212423 RepID=UPI0018A7F19F|nr:phosphotransferase [Streptomyces kaniharaensis]
MTEAMDDATCGSRYSIIEEDLVVLGETFGLGEVQACRFLPNGLMNGNWRLETADRAFALKRIMDVPLSLARRNLAVLAELAAAGVPVGRPLTTFSGQTVAEVADRGYCLIPWMEGSHQPGTEITLDQAGDLGVLLGQIHRSLNDERILLAPLALRPAFPVSMTGRYSRDYYGASAPPTVLSRQRTCPPPHWLSGGSGDRGWFPRSPLDRSVREMPSSTPAASPRLRRRPSTWPPHRNGHPASELTHPPEGGRITHCTPARIHQV